MRQKRTWGKTARWLGRGAYNRRELMTLITGVNSYEWGKAGSDSAAARFAAATPRDDFKVESEKPYAEVPTHKMTRWIRV